MAKTHKRAKVLGRIHPNRRPLVTTSGPALAGHERILLGNLASISSTVSRTTRSKLLHVAGTFKTTDACSNIAHSAEATACDIRTWLDPLFTVDDIYAFELVESSSAAVTQHLLSMIPAVAVTTTAGFTGSLYHTNVGMGGGVD